MGWILSLRIFASLFLKETSLEITNGMLYGSSSNLYPYVMGTVNLSYAWRVLPCLTVSLNPSFIGVSFQRSVTFWNSQSHSRFRSASLALLRSDKVNDSRQASFLLHRFENDLAKYCPCSKWFSWFPKRWSTTSNEYICWCTWRFVARYFPRWRHLWAMGPTESGQMTHSLSVVNTLEMSNDSPSQIDRSCSSTLDNLASRKPPAALIRRFVYFAGSWAI